MQNQTIQEKRSEWTGSVLGLLGTSLACSFIIILTFGIATPWAIAHAIRYIVQHIKIDGKHLTFNGTGGQIFLRWILWVFLTIITLGIYSFWIPNNVWKWIAEHIEAE